MLTKLLTITRIHKFPPQAPYREPILPPPDFDPDTLELGVGVPLDDIWWQQKTFPVTERGVKSTSPPPRLEVTPRPVFRPSPVEVVTPRPRPEVTTTFEVTSPRPEVTTTFSYNGVTSAGQLEVVNNQIGNLLKPYKVMFVK